MTKWPHWNPYKTNGKWRKSKDSDWQTDPKVVHLERDWGITVSLSKWTTIGNTNRNRNKKQHQMELGKWKIESESKMQIRIVAAVVKKTLPLGKTYKIMIKRTGRNVVCKQQQEQTGKTKQNKLRNKMKWCKHRNTSNHAALVMCSHPHSKWITGNTLKYIGNLRGTGRTQ